MKTYPVITISRQFGAGGTEIGRRVASLLEIPFYDNEIIELASKESHFDPKLFRKVEETTATNSFLYAINRLGAGSAYSMPISDQLYSVQSGIIRTIADQTPAVIVGRCADDVLAGYTTTVNVFVQAGMDARVKRTMERLTLSENRARAYVKQIDKSRAAYHNFYSDRTWGRRENYDLIINSDHLDFNVAAVMIRTYVMGVIGEELHAAKEQCAAL
ncbi:MAG: cytidylate kinase-like family protein [Oscillospiraceae bacterium]|nr:cytidylate kinase-like family protein [Oscillospiraceae bacterium]MBR1845544.1 cytidylate kinase-like family protein [Oscillospiraceae bacterium]